MRWPMIRAGTALVLTAGWLGACAHSEPVPALDVSAPAEIRLTLPEPPSDVAACLRRSFPEIPDRTLTTGDVVRIIGRAKVLDRSKTACAQRGLAWITAVRRDFAKP